MSKVAVIGGGAAGLVAAYAAAKNGHEVNLFEKNEKLGKKIYITGKGRCNLTNNVEPNEFLQNVVHNAKFLTGAVYAFPPQAAIDLMEINGTPVKTERGNRSFPVSDHASDVTKALQRACENAGVSIHLQEEVKALLQKESTMSGIVTDKKSYSFDSVIVCTGGLSYPSTGSTGDGYKFAKTFGHTVTELYPALTGIELKDGEYAAMQGLSLKNVTLSAVRNGKTVYGGMGEMLFTHYGISGPLVLTLSSKIARSDVRDLTLSIDLKPALSEDKLDARLLRDFGENKNKNLSNVLGGALPSKMIAPILCRAGILPNKQVNSVTKEERVRLVKTMKNYTFQPLALRGFQEAIITSGGINVKELNPKTMESKLVKGLYFCGEVLDVDAYTGGFNLQIAFSTGYAAGNSVR